MGLITVVALYAGGNNLLPNGKTFSVSSDSTVIGYKSLPIELVPPGVVNEPEYGQFFCVKSLEHGELAMDMTLEEWIEAVRSATTNFVPLDRELTIGGLTYDLSEDRSWPGAGDVPSLQQVLSVGNDTNLGINIKTNLEDVVNVVQINSAGITVQNPDEQLISEIVPGRATLGNTSTQAIVKLDAETDASSGTVSIGKIDLEAKLSARGLSANKTQYLQDLNGTVAYIQNAQVSQSALGATSIDIPAGWLIAFSMKYVETITPVGPIAINVGTTPGGSDITSGSTLVDGVYTTINVNKPFDAAQTLYVTGTFPSDAVTYKLLISQTPS